MHAQGLFTHMPFIVNANTLLFSLGVSNPELPGKDWRIGYIDARKQTWQLFNTGLPTGTVECSPTAYIDNGKLIVCFLASTPDEPTYKLYRLAGSSWETLGQAYDANIVSYHGFVNSQLFATTRFLQNDDIHIRIQKRSGGVKTLVAVNQYVHKVSYLSAEPQKILISVQKKENPRHAKELLLDTNDYTTVSVIKSRGHKLYKLSLFDGFALYGKKLAGFDERQICATNTWTYRCEPLSCHFATVPTTHG